MPRNSSTVPAVMPRTAPSSVVTTGAPSWPKVAAAAPALAAVAPVAVRVSAASAAQEAAASRAGRLWVVFMILTPSVSPVAHATVSRGWPHAAVTPRPLKRSPDAASQPAVAAMLIQVGCSLGGASAVGRLSVQSMVSLRSGWGRHGGEAATAPREEPSLDDELHPARGRVDREQAQLRIAAGRQDDVGDAADDRPAASEQHRPLVAKQRTAAKGDDNLRRAADGGPYAEDREDIRDAPHRGHPQGYRGGDADRGAGEQQLTGRSLLAPRVDHRRDHVDQRIEDEQDPCADRHGSRQGVRRRREDGGPGDGDGAPGEEDLQGPCLVE